MGPAGIGRFAEVAFPSGQSEQDPNADEIRYQENIRAPDLEAQHGGNQAHLPECARRGAVGVLSEEGDRPQQAACETESALVLALTT